MLDRLLLLKIYLSLPSTPKLACNEDTDPHATMQRTTLPVKSFRSCRKPPAGQRSETVNQEK